VQGSFSSDALQAYKTLIAEQHPSDFSEGETYDFTRCVRKDGTVYGTAGQCRKGTEQVKEDAPGKKVRGEGKGVKKGVKPTLPGKPLPPELHSSLSKLSEKLLSKKAVPDPSKGAVTQGKMRLTAKVKALPVEELKKVLNDPRLNDKQRAQVNKLLAERQLSPAIAKKVSAVSQRKASGLGLGPGGGQSGGAKVTKKEVLDDIKSILEENRGPREASKKVNSDGLSYEEEIAAIIDSKIEKSNHVRQGDPKYDGWSRTFGEKAKMLGSGMFGTAILSPDGEVVKRGMVSRTEAAIVDKVGKADLGPKLIAADIGGPTGPKGTGVDLRNGRIAMSKVQGTPLGMNPSRDSSKANTDAYWKARADLHRMGVAHNDMHGGNVLVDEKGKGRFVDMGLAQDNPKAALVEALGAFPGPRGKSADSTFSSWGPGGNMISDVERKNITPKQKANYLAFLEEDAPLAYKAYINKEKAIEKLRSFGIDGEDMTKVLTTKTSTRDEKYKVGPWAKLSDKQAMEVINTLYEGI
jgi:hypothetical protein